MTKTMLVLVAAACPTKTASFILHTYSCQWNLQSQQQQLRVPPSAAKAQYDRDGALA